MRSKEQLATDLLEDTDLENRLIIHNDEVNTFDWVIETLVDVCRHDYEQAEQCAILVHTRGKYAVKHGPLDILNPMRQAISERGIGVTIE